MIRKLFFIIISFGSVGSASISCSSDIPDCPSKMCVMAGGWRLTEASVDGNNDNTDLGKYRLTLIQPDPATATSSNFDRIQPSGALDNGTWSIENNGTILRLISTSNPSAVEDWIIESFTPRELILIINRDSNKEGPSKIRFVLEPF